MIVEPTIGVANTMFPDESIAKLKFVCTPSVPLIVAGAAVPVPTAPVGEWPAVPMQIKDSVGVCAVKAYAPALSSTALGIDVRLAGTPAQPELPNENIAWTCPPLDSLAKNNPWP